MVSVLPTLWFVHIKEIHNLKYTCFNLKELEALSQATNNYSSPFMWDSFTNLNCLGYTVIFFWIETFLPGERRDTHKIQEVNNPYKAREVIRFTRLLPKIIKVQERRNFVHNRATHRLHGKVQGRKLPFFFFLTDLIPVLAFHWCSCLFSHPVSCK